SPLSFERLESMPIALITIASSGRGQHFAYAVARQKYDLFLVARREARLNAVAVRAQKLGAGHVEIVSADLSQRGAPPELYARLNAMPVEVDYLVNNAGFGTTGRFDRMALAREIEEIELNVVSVVALTRLFLPAMIERRRG